MTEVREVFVRKASGLVREVSGLGLLVLLFGYYQAPTTIAFLLSGLTMSYPSSFIWISAIIAFIMSLSFTWVYYFYTVTMPRAGGDYIFTSRTLHPALGFLGSWSRICAGIYWTGLWAGACGTFAIPTTLAAMGAALRNPAYLDLATTIAQPLNAFIIGTVVIIIAALVATRRAREVSRIMGIFSAAILLLFIVCWILLASTPQEVFIDRFNSFAAWFEGTPADYYHKIPEIAHESGFAYTMPTLEGTLFAALFISATYTFQAFAGPYMGGEIKEPRRSALIGMIGSNILICVIIAITGALMYNVMGYDFYNSLNWMYYTGKGYTLYPIPPYYNVFASILTDNPLIIILIGACIVFTAAAVSALWFVQCARILFAWSMDGLTPKVLSEVSMKYHVPVKSTVILAAFMEAMLIVWTARPVFFTWPPGYVFDAIPIALVGAAATLLPYWRWKSTYETSPLKSPIIVIAGVVTVVITVVRIACYVRPEWAGSFPGLTPLWVVVVAIIIPLILFYYVRSHRKKIGIDVDLAYRELPPE